MNCIELMVEEHKNIKRMLGVIRQYCYKVLQGKKVPYDDFYRIIDFVRNYADHHHHGKEETMLFNRMVDEIGGAAEKLIKHGMLVEHDLGRLYMQDLEEAVKRVIDNDDEARLDVIANAISYTHLLNRHIQKEDDVVYQYASRSLKEKTLAAVNNECAAYEETAQAKAAREKYLALISELEIKVKGI